MKSNTEEIKFILENYHITVMNEINEMLIKFQVESKHELLSLKTKYINGNLNIDSDKSYIFHGRGCRVLDENLEEIIDWNFGYDDYWYGLDPYLVYKFLSNNNNHTNFTHHTEVQKIFEERVKLNEMYVRYGLYYEMK